MNAKVEEKKPDLITITVDGVDMQVPKGAMIIEATDTANIDVPRFCYHKKLSIAANCRMCLVEIEQGGRPAPKPMPACATPVADGMKVFTQSPKAIAAQRGVMEFLLINHPLDCPVCDQGGECELQDVAMGYGRGVSRFTERKRIYDNEDIGPLVETEMTRCIHCTRCVRFLNEVAGQKELGGMGRGEYTKISTYVEKSVTSELSGNIIDLCPVGALVSKPYHFQARAWELLSHACISPHDSVGSHMKAHHRRGQVLRVVPRENEAINEVWLSDRDRFSYLGVYNEERLQRPLVKRDGEWQEVSWDDALAATVSGLRRVLETVGAEAIGTLVSPTATVEEMHLLAKLTRGLGSPNIDHRLRQADFRDDADAPAAPLLGEAIEGLEHLQAAFVVGSHLRAELPMINHRLRKAWQKGGKVAFLNPREFEFNYDAEQLVAAPQHMVRELALVAQALITATGATAPDGLSVLTGGATPADAHETLAQRLQAADKAAVLVGGLAEAHPDGAILRALAALVASLANATFGYLPQSANSVGGWLAGILPHRTAAGQNSGARGLDAREMLEKPRKGYLLFNAEPGRDFWNPAAARAAMDQAAFVVAFSPFASDELKAAADVILPIGAFVETSGTYVNLEGRWQSFGGMAAPVGEARPAWRVLRVLGNLLDLEGFDYEASGDVLAELTDAHGIAAGAPRWRAFQPQLSAAGVARAGGVPVYATDSLVRRSPALQATVHATPAMVYVNPALAERLGLADGGRARVRQAQAEAVLPVVVDPAVPEESVWVPAGLEGSAGLGAMIGEVTIEAA